MGPVEAFFFNDKRVLGAGVQEDRPDIKVVGRWPFMGMKLLLLCHLVVQSSL